MRPGDMVRKSLQQETEYVHRLAAVTDWLNIPVEHYPAWTVATLERELAVMNRLVAAVPQPRGRESRRAVEADRCAERPFAKTDRALVERGSTASTLFRREAILIQWSPKSRA